MDYNYFLDNKFELEGRIIDPIEGRVVFRDSAKRIRRKELEVLALLCASRGKLVSRKEFVSFLWDGNTAVGDFGLTRVVASLRKALTDNEKGVSLIRTIPRKGYQLNKASTKLNKKQPSTETKTIDSRWKMIKLVDENLNFEIWQALDLKLNKIRNLHVSHNGRLLEYFKNSPLELKNKVNTSILLRSPIEKQTAKLPLYFVYKDDGYITLKNWIQGEYKNDTLSLKKCFKVLSDLASIIKKLHNEGVVYKNISATSVYVKSESDEIEVILDDIKLLAHNHGERLSEGLRTTYSDHSDIENGFLLNSDYIAPELKKGHEPSFSSDVYSFAVLFKNIILFKEGINPNNDKPVFDDLENLKRLLHDSINGDTDSRPNIASFKKIIDELLISKQFNELDSLCTFNVSRSSDKPEIEGFKILEKLGKGGMSEVYLAEQKEPFLRLVAIKIINKELEATEDIKRRFQSEIRALGFINHQNIASVFEVGSTKEGLSYYVMEFVPGNNIIDYADEHKLDINSRIQLFSQVCDGLIHCHQKGLIHRDINPSNLLIRSNDQKKPIVKIIDFGLVKSIQSSSSKDSPYTQLGRFLGTKKYSSPEQIMGKKELVDTKSDIYSLGVLLYELLTGHLPFDIDTYTKKSPLELVELLKNKSVDEPVSKIDLLDNDEQRVVLSNRSLNKVEQFNSVIKQELTWITLKCLEYLPEQRYESVLELKRDLDNWRQNLPVKANKTNNFYYVKKYIQRNKVTFSLVTGFLSLLLISTYISINASIKTRKTLKEVEFIADYQQQQLTRIETSLLGDLMRNQIYDELDRFSSSNNLISTDKSDIKNFISELNFSDIARYQMEKAYFEPSIEAINKVFKDQGDIKYKLMMTLAETAKTQGMDEIHIDLLKQISEISNDYYGPDHPNTFHIDSMKSLILMDEGKSDEALELARASKERLMSSAGIDDVRTLDAITALGMISSRRAEFDTANELFKKSITGFEKLLGENNIKTMSSQLELAVNLARAGSYDDAGEIFKSVAVHSEQELGETHHFSLLATRQLATFYYRAGKYELSVETASNSIEKFVSKYGIEHPKVLSLLNIKSGALDMVNKNSEAEEVIRQAIAISSERFGEDDSRTLTYKHNLGITLQKQYKFEEAKKIIFDVADDYIAIFGKKDISSITILLSKGELLLALGKFEAANTMLNDLNLIANDFLGADNDLSLMTLYALNEARLGLKFNQQVIQSLSNTKLAETSHRAHFLLAKAYTSENLFENAKVHFETAIDMANDLGNNDPSKYIYMSNFADFLTDHNEFDLARKNITDSIYGLEKIYADQHHELLIAKLNYAKLLSLEGNKKEGTRLYSESLDQLSMLMGSNHPMVQKFMSQKDHDTN